MILVIRAHPYPRHSHAGAALLSAIDEITGVQVRELYKLYPDFSIDVPAEKAALLSADTIVLQHPMFWYHAPALLVLWFEKVLELGWAYGDKKMLAGKRLMWTTTTGGPADSYAGTGARLTMDALSAPLKQTAQFCGLEWLEPFVVHNAGHLSTKQMLIEGQRFRARFEDELRFLKARATQHKAAHGD